MKTNINTLRPAKNCNYISKRRQTPKPIPSHLTNRQWKSLKGVKDNRTHWKRTSGGMTTGQTAFLSWAHLMGYQMRMTILMMKLIMSGKTKPPGGTPGGSGAQHNQQFSNKAKTGTSTATPIKAKCVFFNDDRIKFLAQDRRLDGHAFHQDWIQQTWWKGKLQDMKHMTEQFGCFEKVVIAAGSYDLRDKSLWSIENDRERDTEIKTMVNTLRSIVLYIQNSGNPQVAIVLPPRRKYMDEGDRNLLAGYFQDIAEMLSCKIISIDQCLQPWQVHEIFLHDGFLPVHSNCRCHCSSAENESTNT